MLCSAVLNAVEVHAVYWTKGGQTPIKLEVTIPEDWTTKPSKDMEKSGDYLFTKERTVYMNLNVTDWEGDTTETYAAKKKGIEHIEKVIDGKSIFLKKVTKGGKRILIGRFMPASKVEINTQLVLYKQDTQIDAETQQALAILASAKIIAFPDTSDLEDKKAISVKTSLDKKFSKIEAYAKSGEADKFPRKCAIAHESLVKYAYPGAPKEIYDYYKNAENTCLGKLHTIALHESIKQNRSNVNCKKIELTLQINHLRTYLQKTNNMQEWDDFMEDYKEVCPNHLNF